MEFSDRLRRDGPMALSPDGKLLAHMQGLGLVLRELETLAVVQLYTCLDSVQQVAWSPDSRCVACVMSKRSMLQVWSVADAEWTCKIDAGAEGVVGMAWSPDSRHVLSRADFQLRVTAWSLVDRSSAHLDAPKFDDERALRFSADGKYAALLQRDDGADWLAVYGCADWQLVRRFKIDTDDAVDFAWSPADHALCVWDSPLLFGVHVYSMDGKQLDRFSAYSHALGVKCVSWSPCAQFVAVGSFDKHARLKNHLTWRALADHAHGDRVDGAEVDVYKEVQVQTHPSDYTSVRTRYAIETGVVELPQAVAPSAAPVAPGGAQLGVSTIEWSYNSQYMATREDSVPNCVWIWETAKTRLKAVLVQREPVRALKWDPAANRLAVCTGSSNVFLFQPEGTSCIDIPAEDFHATTCEWSADGSALVLKDRNAYSVMYA